jgi:hypothetical protein
MNHIFCTECGSKMSFLHAKPNFCSKCGAGTGVGVKVDKHLVQEDSLAEDETSIDYVPQIDSLAFETEQYDNNVFTFESLVEGKSSGKTTRNKGSRNLEDFINGKRR